jgi:hypothetical protein
MMNINYHNVNGISGSLSIKVEHNEEEIIFNVSTLLKRVKKTALADERQFAMLTAYLKFIGKEDEVFNIYKQLDGMFSAIMFTDENNLKKHMMTLLSFIDVKTTNKFLREHYGMLVPTRFKEEFDTQQELDGRLTKVQTYTKSQYYDLMAIVIASKILIGPLGEYSHLAGDALPNASNREYVIISGLSKAEHIFNSPISEKLKSMMYLQVEGEIIVDRLVPRIMVPREEVPNYLFYTTFIRKMSVVTPESDTDKTNVVTMCYHAATSLLNGPSSTDKRITFKTALQGDEDSESSLEIYRTTTDVSIGDLQELEIFAMDIASNLYNLGLDVKTNLPITQELVTSIRSLYQGRGT